MTTTAKETPPHIVKTKNSVIIMRCYYPEETSDDVMDTIVRGLEYVGVLDKKDYKIQPPT